jgi:ribose transport system substrate-binding protein
MSSIKRSLQSVAGGLSIAVGFGLIATVVTPESGVADSLNLTAAEHTPYPCQRKLTVEEVSTYKAPKANKHYRMQFSIPTLANPHGMAMVYGAFKAAEEAGVDLQLDTGKTPLDAAAQITQLENGLSRGADALIMSPSDPNALVAAIDEAAAKMPVIDVGTPSNSAKSYKILQDDYSQGKMAGDVLHGSLPNGGEGIVIAGPANHNWARRRVAGFIDGLKQYPNLKINEIANEDIRPDEGLAKFVNAAQAHPKVDWIYVVTAALLPPAAIPPEYKKAVLVTGGLYKYVADALRDGTAAASLPDFPVWIGYLGLSSMIERLNGGETVQRTCIPIAAITKADLDRDYVSGGNIIPPNWTPPTK